LINFGWVVEDIAVKTGHTTRYVNQALELSDAPQEVKEMLSRGTVTPALARTTLKKKGDGAVAALRERVAEAEAKGQKTATAERKPVQYCTSDAQALTVADRIVILVLAEHPDWDEITEKAKKYQKLRKG
jgi:ParB-like chromosome segregation protein Spo0J